MTRMLIPAIAAFFVGNGVMGVVAAMPDYQLAGRTPSSLGPPVSALSSEPVTAGFQHFFQVVNYWLHVPAACSGEPANEFQKGQCADFWTRIMTATAVAAIPLGVVAVFLMFVFDLFNGLYRRSGKTLDKGKALFAGIVTEPAEAPTDAFCWFYCLRAISIQLGNKQQMKVYIPIDVPIPFPGQTLAVFDGGKAFGAKRYIAMLYAPHVAVVTSGGR